MWEGSGQKHSPLPVSVIASLNENMAAFYAQEEKYARLFQLFCIVFLLIGPLGSYGLITFQ
jgi:hypothetical protein